MSLETDSIELDHDTAALVIRSDGGLEIYIPKASDNDMMPAHAEAIAALGSYWVEHHEEILKWFSERVKH